MTVTSQEVA